MMKTGSKQQHSHNKFLRFVTLPLRALGKAKDFYVRSMINCAEGKSSFTYGQPMGGTLPKSFSARSAASSNEGDDYSELLRAASVRSMGHLNEIDMLLKQHLQQRQQQQLGGSINGTKSAAAARFPKSVSVGMVGFMGRIDEEKPGDSEDGSYHHARSAADQSSVYPRSKSVAVAF